MGNDHRHRGVAHGHRGDHPPLHVHIFESDKEVGRWDIENQRPMDDFEMTRRLRNALRELGYLLEVDGGQDN